MSTSFSSTEGAAVFLPAPSSGDEEGEEEKWVLCVLEGEGERLLEERGAEGRWGMRVAELDVEEDEAVEEEMFLCKLLVCEAEVAG